MKSNDRYKGQLGQATIEYVLMLVVSVGLVLMLMFQIFKPMQKFIDAYMGLYVQCLLEYGELPSFGGDSVVKDDGECNAKFENYTGTGGRPPKGGGSSGGTNSNTADRDGDASSDGTSAGSTGGGAGADSGSSTYAGSASRGGSRFMRSGRGTAGVDSGGASDKVSEISVGEGAGGGSGFYASAPNGQTVIIRKVTKIPAENISETLKERLKKKETGGKSTVIGSDESFGNKKKKMLVNKPPERQLASDDAEVKFSIGDTFRFLFIVAIILIIVVFVGGQFLQMSKSDKE